MKHRTLSKSAFAVSSLVAVFIVSGALVACASDNADLTDTVPADDDAGPPPPTKLPPSTAPDAAPPPSTTKVCVATCTADSECASSCPALAGGVQCCDLQTKTCWGSKTATCPAPVDPPDASTPPLY